MPTSKDFDGENAFIIVEDIKVEDEETELDREHAQMM